MVRPAEIIRHVVGKTEVGLPKFSPEQRQDMLTQARTFVTEVRTKTQEAGVDRTLFDTWMPEPKDFARPERLANNPHAYHNMRHVGSVLAEEIFLLPYVEKEYSVNLSPNAVYASAAGHDLLRHFDVWGAFPPSLYRIHGQKMAEEVRSGKRFLSLSPKEREITATAIQYHDVDPRPKEKRNPEDELLAIVDRGEGARLLYGVGFWPKMGRRFHLFDNQQKYDSHYFRGLSEKLKPLSTAMMYLGIEYMRKGLDQKEAVWHAMQELGMTKED